MTALYGVLGIVVVGAVAVLLARPRALLAEDPVPGRPPVLPGEGLPSAEELAAVRFPVAVRGYRMADVDAYFAAASAALAAATQQSAEPTAPEPPGELVTDSGQEAAQPVADRVPTAVPAAEGLAVAAAVVAAAQTSDTEVPGTQTPNVEIPDAQTLDAQTPHAGLNSAQPQAAGPIAAGPEAAELPEAAGPEAAELPVSEVSSGQAATTAPDAEADVATATEGEDGLADASTDAVPATGLPPGVPTEQRDEHISGSDIDALGVADPVGAPQVSATGDRQLPD